MNSSNNRGAEKSGRRKSASKTNPPTDDIATMPPTAEREAQPNRASSAMPLVKANPALSPGARIVEPPDEVDSDRHYANALPPEADGANPFTLGPDDPSRESDEGQPYLDDANPYGRPLVNRRNRPMGGVGTAIDPNDEERPLDKTDRSSLK
jgi:hypothetical protein